MIYFQFKIGSLDVLYKCTRSKIFLLKGDDILAPAASEAGRRCLEDILAPASESGRRSVEEMQKSLSTESSPSSSRVIHNILDRKIYFLLRF